MVQVIRNFIQSSTSGGMILFLCVIASLVIANSPLAGAIDAILNTQIGFQNAYVDLNYPVILWINDGLMAIFFLLIGLEIKRELLQGELSTPQQASLPILSAIGGAVVPAGIYILINYGTSTASGWGIPMATDIAFALAVVAILGKRVPLSLKIFLTALAIVDDFIAILVIAIFYSAQLHLIYLVYALALLALLFIFNRLGVRSLVYYLIPGMFIWYFVHHSGIHATIAGVLTALVIPLDKVDKKEPPLIKLEHALTVPVTFLILPVFAFSNTNIQIEDGMIEGLVSPLGAGIFLGLILGKPIGIFLMTSLALRLGLGKLPHQASWMQIVGVSLLAGIGFTMSIFIALLSFSDHTLISGAKFSILVASLISGILGYILLRKGAKPVSGKKSSA